MTTPSIQSLLCNIPSSLGSYAPVLEEIEAALQSPQCSLASIGEAIEKEPDLTARLLRLGNSSFYGFSMRLSTVAEAVSLIGIRQVQDLIAASSVIQQFSGVSDKFVNMQSFWQHSLACGIGARLLALERRLPKPDRFFVAGLLHDVGRLVLFSQTPEVAERIFELCQGERRLLYEAETAVLGFDHQRIGSALMLHWSYPAVLAQAVGHHHQPAIAPAGALEATVVHVSDYLVNAMRIGSSGERFVPPLSGPACATLGLDPEALAGIVAGIDEQLEAVQEVFLGN